MKTSGWAGVILSGLVCACGDDVSRVELLPYLDYCLSFQGMRPCVVSEDGYKYDFIEGLELEWGYHTVAMIETRHIDNPPEDGSSIEYSLVEVERRTPVAPGTRFEWEIVPRLVPGLFAYIVAGDCAQGFELFPRYSEEKPFSFDTSAACESFEQLLATQVPHKLSFEFDTPEAPLKLVAFE